MLLAILRWFARNISTLILAFILSLVVWVSAVVTADPNRDDTFSPVPLQQKGKDANLVLVGKIPAQVTLSLKAPQSIWSKLNNNPGLAEAWIDLTGLGAGEHTVKVQANVDLTPVRILQRDPQEVTFNLEPSIKKTFPVQLIIEGDPTLGYRKDEPQAAPSEVTLSGRESLVSQVVSVQAVLNITGAGETVKRELPLEALDANGDPVADVTISPRTVMVTQPIHLLGGFKTVVIKPVTQGNPAPGYRLTNIQVAPLSVTVFSSNPQFVNELPGYVETKPIDLTGLSDDIEVRVELDLPSEVTLVGEQSVLVQVSVAAIESSMTISLPVETQGLPPALQAHVSPAVIGVIVSGPLPVLDTLTPDSFRVVVNLAGLDEGVYQLEPVVDLIPSQVQIQTILPETVEVTITQAPTPTVAPTAGTTAPGTVTPGLPTGTPTP